MFKVENTGTVAWKRILDENDNPIANLDELSTGDWSITKLSSLDWVVENKFTSPSRAATWLWKNRFDLGEPFNQYPETDKANKKNKILINLEKLSVDQQPITDLFWDYKK